MTQKTLSVKLELLTAGFAKNLNNAVGQVINSTKRMTKEIQGLGARMSVAVALPATLLGKSLLKMAGDAEDASDKFSAVFGDSAPKIEKSINNLSKVFTRNTTDLKNYASEFGSMYTSMNLTEEEAGALSRSMVQLGLDVASLRGVSDSKVMDSFTASLTGNTKGLKSLGISISEAEIQAEAFTMGIKKTVSELSERDKALIMTSLLQKNFTKDVGDASKSQNDWGEVMNQFNGKVKTLGENLGKELIPMVSSLVDKIEPLIEYFMSLDDSVKRGAMSVLVLAVLLPPLITVLGTLGNTIIAVVGFIWTLIKSLAVAISSVILFGISLLISSFKFFIANIGLMSTALLNFTMVAVPVVVIIASVVQIVRMAIRFYALMAGVVADNANAIIKLFTPALFGLITSVKGVIYAFTYAKNALDGHESASYRASKAVEDLTKMQNDLVDAFIGNKDSSDFANNLSASLYKVETALNGTAENLDDMLLSANASVQNAFGETADFVKAKMGGAWDTVAGGAKSAFGSALDFMKDMAIGSLALIGDFDPFKNLKKPKTSKGTPENPADPKSMVKNTLTLKSQTSGPITNLDQGGSTEGEEQKFNVLTGLWRDLSDHITETMITTADIVTGVWDNVFSSFSAGISGMILEGNSFHETFKNMFKSLADFVIQSIIKMGMQWVMTELMKRMVSGATSKIVQTDAITNATIATTASVASSQTMIANNAVVAGSGAASSQAGVPIIGPILAVAAMGAMIATVMALQGKLKLASGGITQGPTNALIGEKGKEAVIPLDRLDSIMGNREQTIIMNLDGRTLAKTVIKNSPREIRLSTGVLM